MTPDGSSMSTAARALFFGAAGMRSVLGTGAAAQGSGSRCGTIGAAFDAGASMSGATSLAELLLAASFADSGSAVAGEGAGVLPDEQAASRTKATNGRRSRRWKRLVIK